MCVVETCASSGMLNAEMLMSPDLRKVGKLSVSENTFSLWEVPACLRGSAQSQPQLAADKTCALFSSTFHARTAAVSVRTSTIQGMKKGESIRRPPLAPFQHRYQNAPEVPAPSASLPSKPPPVSAARLHLHPPSRLVVAQSRTDQLNSLQRCPCPRPGPWLSPGRHLASAQTPPAAPPRCGAGSSLSASGDAVRCASQAAERRRSPRSSA